MRRAVAWGLALALIVALTACGFMRWPLSAAKVGDSLNAAFGASPRLHWSAPERASFSVLPRPSVRIADARLDDAYGVNLLSAPEARLNLSLIELLRGRFIPTGVVLVSPTVTIDIDRPPFAGAAGESAGPASVARRALAPLASLSLSNGILRVVSAKRGVDATIDNVHGRFNGLTIGDQLRFDLSAVWRKTPIAIAGALNDPETAAKGDAESDGVRAQFAFGQACVRRLARARRQAQRRRRFDCVHPLDRRPGFFPRRSAASRSCRQRHHDHSEGQGSGGFTDLRRRDDDQRRADARGRGRNQRSRRAPGHLRDARRRNAGAGAAARTARARLRPIGRVEHEALRVRASAELRPRPAFVRGASRRLRPQARRRRRIRNRHGWQAQRDADRGCGLWRPPPGRSRRGLRRAKPQAQRAWRTRRRRPGRRDRRFRPADRHWDRRGEIHASRPPALRRPP